MAVGFKLNMFTAFPNSACFMLGKLGSAKRLGAQPSKVESSIMASDARLLKRRASA